MSLNSKYISVDGKYKETGVLPDDWDEESLETKIREKYQRRVRQNQIEQL